MSTRRVEVVDKKTGIVVKSLDASKLSQRDFERAFSGLSRQVNHDDFYVRERVPGGCQ